jgi:hyperosmotically inducible protein
MQKFVARLAMAAAVTVVAMPVPVLAQVSDTALADLAAAAVRRYVHFSIFDDVNIAVNDRTVTLTGRVTMPFKRDEIATRVGGIDGLRGLVNEIRVLPASAYDAKLRVAVAKAIYGHPSFWHYGAMVNPPIHIVVEGGRVTLTGRVATDVERMLANALAQVEGAISVSNSLKLDKNQVN